MKLSLALCWGLSQAFIELFLRVAPCVGCCHGYLLPEGIYSSFPALSWVFIATESNLYEASGFASSTLPWAEAPGLGWNICPGSHGESMGLRLEPQFCTCWYPPFPASLMLHLFSSGHFCILCPKLSSQWMKRLCVPLLLSAFPSNFRTLSKSQKRKKSETIPYYSTLKVLVCSCGSTFRKGRKDH